MPYYIVQRKKFKPWLGGNVWEDDKRFRKKDLAKRHLEKYKGMGEGDRIVERSGKGEKGRRLGKYTNLAKGKKIKKFEKVKPNKMTKELDAHIAKLGKIETRYFGGLKGGYNALSLIQQKKLRGEQEKERKAFDKRLKKIKGRK